MARTVLTSDENDGGLLGMATDSFGYSFDPSREQQYTRPACAEVLIDAGAAVDAKDAHGDTPLSWASWYLRPTPILRELLYGDFRIHPQNQPMRANLIGKPHA